VGDSVGTAEDAPECPVHALLLPDVRLLACPEQGEISRSSRPWWSVSPLLLLDARASDRLAEPLLLSAGFEPRFRRRSCVRSDLGRLVKQARGIVELCEKRPERVIGPGEHFGIAESGLGTRSKVVQEVVPQRLETSAA
jgi:hypothetical protein